MEKKIIESFMVIIMKKKLVELFIVIILLTLIYFDLDNILYKYYFNRDNRKIKVLQLINKDLCNKIINEGEEYAKVNKWKTDRHDNYPTTDNEITQKWKIFYDMKPIIRNNIYDEIAKNYNVDKTKLSIKEVFLVKYSMDGQQKLDYHLDGSNFSFIITLNEDYTGGGTTFRHKNELYKPKTGECVIFCGDNEHRGNIITSGTRYILTGFIAYYEENSHYVNIYRNILSYNLVKTNIVFILIMLYLYIK